MDDIEAMEIDLDGHQTSVLMNMLMAVATKYHGTNSLRTVSPHQSSDDVKGDGQHLVESPRLLALLPFMDVFREVPGHDFLNQEEAGRAEAAAVDPDDVWMIQTGHDLKLVLRS